MQEGMGGFVANWAGRVGPGHPNLRIVMDYLGAEEMPVFAKLADEFAICDRWYCAFPGPTWPNRFIFLSGHLSENKNGETEIHNPDLKTMLPRTAPLILDYLSDRGQEWRVFEHGYSFPRLFAKYTFNTSSIVPFNDPNVGFEAVARTGLPAVTFIEPDYIEVPPGNDDHAPADVADGQHLVGRIMNALVQSPSWNKTLFVITYDEHGGFYDHVMPPDQAVPFKDGRNWGLGPRVPTFVVSPWIARGTVLHSQFDHTSIGATILRRFCGPNVPSIGGRMDVVTDLKEALNLDTPRPGSEFAMFGAGLGGTPGMTVRSAAMRRERIGKPESPGDFHWFLGAIRMITGSP
jgi:phospholipase C